MFHCVGAHHPSPYDDQLLWHGAGCKLKWRNAKRSQSKAGLLIKLASWQLDDDGYEINDDDGRDGDGE